MGIRSRIRKRRPPELAVASFRSFFFRVTFDDPYRLVDADPGNEAITNFLATVLVAQSMNYREVSGDREFVARLAHGADWREEIESLADEESIDAAWFVAMGAVQDATVWFYDQSELEYREVEFDEPLEVAACVGNVSWLDGERFAHTHAVLSRRSGQTLAGHLDSATVFAGELYVRSFEDELEREHHEPTDLDLWL